MVGVPMIHRETWQWPIFRFKSMCCEGKSQPVLACLFGADSISDNTNRASWSYVFNV